MLVAILLGEDATRNPRKLAFLKGLPKAVHRAGMPTAGLEKLDDAFGIYDPWGQTYRVLLDTDYDEQLENPEPGVKGQETLKVPIAVWSAGPDGDFDTWEDNVCSWKQKKQ